MRPLRSSRHSTIPEARKHGLRVSPMTPGAPAGQTGTPSASLPSAMQPARTEATDGQAQWQERESHPGWLAWHWPISGSSLCQEKT